MIRVKSPNLQLACTKRMDHLWGLVLGFAKCQSLCQGRRLKNGHGKVSRTGHTCQNLCQPPNLQLACSKTMDPLSGVRFRFCQMPKSLPICQMPKSLPRPPNLQLGFAKCQSLCQARRLKNAHAEISAKIDSSTHDQGQKPKSTTGLH